MTKRATKSRKKQADPVADAPVLAKVHQLLMPMVAGMVATRQCLQSWVHEAGLEALQEVFAGEVEALAGPKGKHQPEREFNRWGSTPASFPFGGRNVTLPRPRVRGVDGLEATLPSVEAFQAADPMPERVVNQILLGVSTRGYEPSLEPAPPKTRSRGTSKSSASRHLVAKTKKKMKDYLSSSLEEVDLIGLMVDGLEIAGRTVVVALGITADATKVPLGLWLGSTENHTVCTALLQNLLERDLRIDDRILCVIDGGKGIRKALNDVFGDLAVVQRCQVHKMRNLRDHLPKERHAYAMKVMREAYRSTKARTARKRLRQLITWLERNGEDSAAASLREGLEETLTVLKLELPPTLTRSLSTTNAIENLIGSVRRTTRNVKRWRDGSMIRRWVALAISNAESKFRRLKGHRSMPQLVAALRGPNAVSLDSEEVAA